MAPEPAPADDEATQAFTEALTADRAESLSRERQRTLRQHIPDQWDVARGRAKRRR